MFKEHHWVSTLVTHNNDNYSYSFLEVKGLNIHFLKNRKKLFFLDRAIVQYLFHQAKTIHTLNLYHLTKNTIFYGIIYKILNKDGLLYLKMDVYNEHLEKGIKYSKKKWKDKWFKKLEKKFLNTVDVISIENEVGLRLLVQKFPFIKNKVLLMPNGVDCQFLDTVSRKKFEEKENIVLTVGRIGHPEKNNTLLLEALKKIRLDNWKVIFVGPIEEAFNQVIQDFYRINPHLKETVIFTGPCFNRIALYDYYNKSKIFCLTSHAESFGIAFVEALFFGNFLVGNEKMFAFDLITNQGEFGLKYKEGSAEDLADKINRLISQNEALGKKTEASAAFARINFCWKKLTKALDTALKNHT